MAPIRRIGGEAVREAIERIAGQIAGHHAHSDGDSLVVVGVADGGIAFGQRLARHLAAALGREVPFGTVDILFHRDDLAQNPIRKISFPTDLPFGIDGATVILCDDVLFTGRSTRAAINELFDQGRPERIELAVLFDRGSRRLPLQPDYVGFAESIPDDQLVVVAFDGDQPATDAILIEERP